MLKIFVTLILSLGFISCMQNFSTTKVTNGQETTDYPGIVNITIQKDDGATSCTANIVSTNTLLTAGHCVNIARSQDAVSVKIDGKTYTSKKLSHHPEYKEENEDTAVYDIAVVVFPDEPFKDIEPLQVSSSVPGVGTVVRLVGFGCKTVTSGSSLSDLYGNYGFNNYPGYGMDYGYGFNYGYGLDGGYGGSEQTIECEADITLDKLTKRTGTSKISSDGSGYCLSGMVSISQDNPVADSEISNPTGEDVAPHQGDSGGGLLLESDHTQIVGIASYIDVSKKEGRNSCYSSPAYTSNMNYLKDTISSLGAVINGVK